MSRTFPYLSTKGKEMSPMYLYLLRITDEGLERAPQYEINGAMVVRAGSARHARTLASRRIIDESPETWISGRYSTCRRLGEVTAGSKRTAEVVLAEDNAS